MTANSEMANKSALPSETWTATSWDTATLGYAGSTSHWSSPHIHGADVGDALSALVGCALDRQVGSVDGLAEEDQDGQQVGAALTETS